MNLKGGRGARLPDRGKSSIINLVYFGTELPLIGVNGNQHPALGGLGSVAPYLRRGPEYKGVNKYIAF